MEIEIRNCNNIDECKVKIIEGSLNIKYAINGTGKSTIAKAILSSVNDRINGSKSLPELTPFKAKESGKSKPSVIGTEIIASVMIFDEHYVNDFVFQPDELLRVRVKSCGNEFSYSCF